MKVHVYWNIPRKCWSVRDAKSRLVVHHSRAVTLRDVRFFVSEKGRQRVLRVRQRGVHAWAIGELVSLSDMSPVQSGIPITYNPYRGGDFTTRDGIPVDAAGLVVFSGSTANMFDETPAPAGAPSP
jgi:hypothetical protein